MLDRPYTFLHDAPPPARPRFRWWEMAVVGAMLLVLAAVLFPIFARPHGGSRRRQSCQSNLKQVGLAFLQYIQDYDGRFPPVVGRWRDSRTGVWYQSSWGPDVAAVPEARDTYGNALEVPGVIGQYVKSNGIFQCYAVAGKRRRAHDMATTHYLYNDLAATVRQDDFTNVKRSVLAAEGEEFPLNAGHAWTPDEEARDALPDGRGLCPPGRGATVKDAPLRHSEGSNYLFADGHVKWHKPVGAVFYPPLYSADRGHRTPTGRQTGPNPAGNMAWDGGTYAATFHVR